MSSMQEDIQCAGSDTRPPMLDRTDFESWQQRIRLYCLGKDNGENIMKSIKEGPFHMGTVSDVITGGTEGAVQQGPVRARVLNDLSCNGLGHIARECPRPKRLQDSDYFKDKMLLMQAQENTPFEVQGHDTFENHMDEYHEVHEMQ
ncbi:retrovirus-related pol polyprotein from transposon TNT 1-94, partial [Tanacetum coccineum]